MKNLKQENLVFYLQKEENWGANKFRKCVQKAYISEKVEKYLVGTNVVFQQGFNRKAVIPVDIVEDILGIAVELPRRVA